MSKKVQALILAAVVAIAGYFGYQHWRTAQSALPKGIASGNGRIEAKLVDIAPKESLRVKEIRCHSARKREIAPVSDGRCWKWRDQNGLASRICCKYENDGRASVSSLIFTASNRMLSRPLHEFSMRV